jgi:hypothetical protein
MTTAETTSELSTDNSEADRSKLVPADPPAGGRELPATRRSALDERAASTIEVDDSHLVAGYANFCRVSSTPEELILDLGLNPQPLNPEVTKVSVSQRIIMNHFTAKRLLGALSMALQRHEAAFGVLETDVRRRVRGN